MQLNNLIDFDRCRNIFFVVEVSFLCFQKRYSEQIIKRMVFNWLKRNIRIEKYLC